MVKLSQSKKRKPKIPRNGFINERQALSDEEGKHYSATHRPEHAMIEENNSKDGDQQQIATMPVTTYRTDEISTIPEQNPEQINASIKNQQRNQNRRSMATTAAANRKDLMNNGRLNSVMQQQTMPDSQASKHGSQSVEPGFRVYGKNHAARDFNDMVKTKAKLRIAQMANETGQDFSFRARTGNQNASPRTELVSQSNNRD